jgi:hypothetical protein
VLNGQLSLHGLDDVEPFVARVIDATLRRRNIALDAHRKEEVLAYAVSELWVASRKYDARRYKSFGQFADGVVRRRVIDWLRADLGRSRWRLGNGYVHERERPQFVSLDAAAGGDRLGSPLERSALDREDCSLDLRRVLSG